MIAKLIPRGRGRSSTARLVRYVVAAKGREDPRTWARTADYILDTSHDGEKVSGVRVSNCHADDPAMAALEIEATQAQNTRSKTDKVEHLVFSFPAGERPPLAVLHAIEDRLCAALGLADHQRISAIHDDTDCLHVHVAINKVHPVTLRNVTPYYGQRQLMKACDQLESEFGLIKTNHGRSAENQGERDDDRDDRDDRYSRYDRTSRTHRRAVRQQHRAALAEKTAPVTIDRVRNLSGVGLVHDAKPGEVLLPGHASAQLGQRRSSDAADELRRPGSRDSGADEPGSLDRLARGAPGGRAGDMEAHAGIESLAGWVRREVLPQIQSAGSWHAVHVALGENGLELRARGAGLVISDRGSDTHVRASSVDRALSMKAMTNKLGAFEPAAWETKPAGRSAYVPKPLHQHAATAGLFTEFNRARDRQLALREAARATLKTDRARAESKLQSAYAMKRSALKAVGGAKLTKQLASKQLAAARKLDRLQLQTVDAEKRKQLAAAFPLPTWQQFVQERAQAGDEQALAVLRSRAEREQKIAGDLLTAADPARSRHRIFADMKPQLRKDGSVLYRTADGGRVIDGATQVRADRSTTNAAYVALTIAAERFGGQALIVEGTAEFKAEVAKLAGLHRLNVTFADPAMEAAKTAIKTPQLRAPTVSADPVDAYIAGRNRDRERISSIDYNRRWLPSDSGAVEYRGSRRLGDGTEILLFKRGDQMLVKPATAALVAHAKKLTVGQTVQIDERGRFTRTATATRGKGNEGR